VAQTERLLLAVIQVRLALVVTVATGLALVLLAGMGLAVSMAATVGSILFCQKVVVLRKTVLVGVRLVRLAVQSLKVRLMSRLQIPVLL
jgi:hypothetical protein